ncbi:MAG TPA: hypothetical protein DIC34_05535 [Treponema sp.]|nr:MAG: hypothetical protein A2Y36_11800 [Treponema sp. GWA1_62_8]OHE65713.1 MAG: hypothetical protein A2001_14955 [Treponema sp. GWC1_61_84]HCM25999.1 hypothetical protein [Treponema sp.]
MTIVGIFLNNEIRTGGHRRYLELLEDLAGRGNTVFLILNEDLEYEANKAITLRVKAKYTRRGLPPASGIFAQAIADSVGNIRAVVPQADWILIHGETHLKAGMTCSALLGGRLLFGHRSNAVRELLNSRMEGNATFADSIRSRLELIRYRAYERSIAKSADAIVFQSEYDRDDFLSRTTVRGSVHVIGGNIGEPRFKRDHANANTSQSLSSVLFIGTYGSRKGLRYLLEAAGILASRGIFLRFVIVGPGEQKERFIRQAEGMGLSEAFEFHGRVPDPFPYLSSADLLVVPSVFDSYPDTILEALHAGTPVIASSVGGIPEMLFHEALLFPPMDAAALADRIGLIAKDPGQYAKIKSLCASRATSFHFDWAERWELAMSNSEV